MTIHPLQDGDWDKYDILAKPYVIDFWADWCGPCKLVSPIIKKLSEEFPEIKVFTIDADANPELTEEYGVKGLPTVLFFDAAGVKVTSLTGAKPLGTYRNAFTMISQSSNQR